MGFENKRVVVVGASRGIGLELARCFNDAGAKVVGTCRKKEGGLASLDVEVVRDVDVREDQAIDHLAASLAATPIDVLVINSGILRSESLDSPNLDSVREQLEVNSIGPLRVVAGLQGLLRPGSKVAILTSRMGSIADNTSGGMYGYRMSKAAVNAAGRSLAHDLKPQQVSVALLHPGFVKTEMTGNRGHVDAETSAKGLVARIDEMNLENSGGFMHANGEILPW